jgi:DNA-binding NarL/FixJ family response regulator
MVGDCDTSDPVQALVRAAREAMVNAAKHSGADKIDVYAEVSEELVEVFVRDRGQGFDADGRGRGPAGRQTQHHRPDGPSRRVRHCPFPTRGRHRSTTGDQEMTVPTPPRPPVPQPGGHPTPQDPTAEPRGPYRVVVVDDHAMFRTGVKAEIGRSVAVVGEAADADRAIAVVLQTPPDVVLLDVHLPGGGGIEVLRKVHEKNPEQKFLALSVSDAAEDVIGLIRAGARGYVTKSISGAELIDAIRRIAEGDAVFSPRLAGFVLDAFSGAIDLARRGRGSRPALGPGTRSDAADRPRLRVQGGGQGAVHLDQDRRDPRQ